MYIFVRILDIYLMVSICLNFKWSGFQISDPFQNPNHLQTSLFFDHSKSRQVRILDPNCIKNLYSIKIKQFWHEGAHDSLQLHLSLLPMDCLWRLIIVFFLKWQQCHFPVMVFCFVYGNVLRGLLIFYPKLFSCPIPYFNLQLLFIEDGQDLALNSFFIIKGVAVWCKKIA